jgi:hypothetical protein
MKKLLDTVEIIIALAGVLVCVLAGLMRLVGVYQFNGLQSITIFIVGMGAMLIAILLKLHLRA